MLLMMMSLSIYQDKMLSTLVKSISLLVAVQIQMATEELVGPVPRCGGIRPRWDGKICPRKR